MVSQLGAGMAPSNQRWCWRRCPGAQRRVVRTPAAASIRSAAAQRHSLYSGKGNCVNSKATIWRYREKALNAAALLAGLSTSRLEDSSRLHDLAERQDDLIGELLHDFAFSARKYLEQFGRAHAPVRAMAEMDSVACIKNLVAEPAEADTGDFTTRSVFFLLGRVIHSESLEVERASTWVPRTDPPVFMEHAWGFRVRSDHDVRDGTLYFVYIEFLIEQFISIDEHFVSQRARLTV